MARFRKIRGMIKMASKMGIDITADDNIKAYLDYRDGTSTAYETTPRKRGSSQPITLLPFYTRAFTKEYRHSIKMSGRAFAQIGNLGATEAKLNIDSATAAEATVSPARKVRGFRPALCVVTQSLTTPVDKKSGITLLTYKKQSGESFSLPFGAGTTAGKKTYPEMTGYLLQEIGRGTVVVSFRQEKPGVS